MFGEVGVVNAVRGVILLLEDYGMVMEWLFGLRAMRWKEVESVCVGFFRGKLKQQPWGQEEQTETWWQKR